MITKRRFASISGVAAVILLTQGTAFAGSTYGLGVEGFRDNYKEDVVDLDNHADYGSLTAYYSYGGSKAFVALDGRASYGKNDYESISGTINGVPQWEYELRLRAGPNLTFWNGTLSPYIGLGGRYFVDQGKGYVTDTGARAYDRRIAQLYLPVGVTYSYVTDGGWTLAPNIEFDELLTGNVDSRLQNDGGFDVHNKQDSGYGIRGEFMVGQSYSSFAWQAGPFARYWHIKDSDVVNTPDLPPNLGIKEPENSRTQVGVAVRFLW